MSNKVNKWQQTYIPSPQQNTCYLESQAQANSSVSSSSLFAANILSIKWQEPANHLRLVPCHVNFLSLQSPSSYPAVQARSFHPASHGKARQPSQYPSHRDLWVLHLAILDAGLRVQCDLHSRRAKRGVGRLASSCRGGMTYPEGVS